MTKLAYLIAKREGFFVAGSLPQRQHNPGDLRHSPHSEHLAANPNGIGIIGSDANGWADLERQLSLYADRGMTVADAIEAYAPANENDTSGYLQFIVDGLGLPGETPVSVALEQQQ